MRKRRSLSSYPALPLTIVCLISKLITFPSGQGAWCGIPPSHHVVFYRLRGQKLGQLQKLTLTQGVEFSFFAPKGVADGPRKLNRTENTRSESQLSFSAQAASCNYK